MKNSKTINITFGWLIFLIAAATYFLTLEPTVSWWDCGEFIISAYRLEVGHPPGAPFFMILGRVFSLLASSKENVALMINALSALASAGTAMLLYWSIVHLAQNLFKNEKATTAQQIICWGSGWVGALAYTFTDTAWFSAVEAEVYSLSSLFTAAVFWAMLKWESVAHQRQSGRWLILIAYLLGLSIGIHLLNLLTLPALGLILYFKRYNFSWKGFLVSLIISGGILLIILYVIIPGFPALAFIVDKLVVNHFNFAFNSGVYLLFFIIIGLLSVGIYLTIKRKMLIWNTVLTALTVIMIGYSSYALIIIRSSADTPMNQNKPDNAFNLLKYLNREQYGQRPLFYGKYYNAPIEKVEGEKKQYNKVNGKYKVTGKLTDQVIYNDKMQTYFPRMYSDQPHHIREYKSWANIKGRRTNININGNRQTLYKPTFGENLRFLFQYQLGHMYFRYFMWNFAGRQNDIQGHGGFLYGNWISGINFLDKMRLDSQDKQPSFIKNQASRNQYYFLPLILGLMGLFFQYNKGKKGKKDFMVTLFLFVLTGIAIVIYLNQTPIQPRERDYAYAGSFYAFSIWIGLGVAALYSMIKKFLKSNLGAILTILIALTVPALLAFENWDDHNRSNRYMTRDYAKNYLESCEPNAILFCYGDNDTFPLWYAQETEGIRTDIKVVNISYLAVDWYINQQRKKSYEAEPVPFLFDKEKYYTGHRDGVFVLERVKGFMALKNALKVVASDDSRTKVETVSGEKVDFMPTKKLYIPVDKEKIIKDSIVSSKFIPMITDSIKFEINTRQIGKNDLALLNIIAANNWERPIYFNGSVLDTPSAFFNEWLQFNGFVYKLVPVQSSNDAYSRGIIDTDILYDNLMNKYQWGNVNNPKIHLDEYNKRILLLTKTRSMFTRLAFQLINEDKKEKAVEVLDKMFALFPNTTIPLTYSSIPAIEMYYKAGAVEKANKQLQLLASNSYENLDYYLSLSERKQKVVESQKNQQASIVAHLIELAKTYKQHKIATQLENRKIQSF